MQQLSKFFRGGKEGPPSGESASSNPVPEPTNHPLMQEMSSQSSPNIAELENEAETAFSQFMNELEELQNKNPNAPFFIKFGARKGEKLIGSFSNAQSLDDSRVLLLIAPDDKGSFTIITRQTPKEIKPDSDKIKTSGEAQSVQSIIDHCLKQNKGGFGGGFFYDYQTKIDQVTLGYHYGERDYVRIDYDLSSLSTPSTEAVIGSIQRSRELVARLEEEKQKPIRDAIALVQQRRIMAERLSESLKKPL